MPSSTFFHLPAEKRENLLQCARDEFARVPYDQVSINKIIQAAGISRGSFYMYFTDKSDLFRHLNAEYGQRLENRLEALLDAHGGDPFAGFLALFDYIQSDYRVPAHACNYQSAIQIMRLNQELRPTVFLTGGLPPVIRRLAAKIDHGRLDLRSPDDLDSILHTLVSVTAPAVVEGILAEDPAPIRERYASILSILARGMAKKPVSVS